MNKVVIILPYFGRFNNYFPLFLKSCEYNPNTDWIIFTDDDTPFRYPSNVHVYYMDFSQLQAMVQEKFDFKISLEKPYKLCDYKVAYGYIFRDYIEIYDYWGFCDSDVIWGDLDGFLSEILNEKYLRYFALGHLALYQNNEMAVKSFMGQYEGEDYYRKVFSNERIWGFDELESNEIIKLSGEKVYAVDSSANASVYYYRYRMVKRIQDLKRHLTEEYVPAVYLWEKGKIKRYFYNDDNGKLDSNEFPYMHLQQRVMKLDIECNKSDYIQIMPDRFVARGKKDIDNFMKMRNHYWNIEMVCKCAGNRWRWRVKRILNMFFPGRFSRAKR